MLTNWYWLVATWIILIISITTTISFQCSKKGNNAKGATPAGGKPGDKPTSQAKLAEGGAAAPGGNPPAEADAADGHYEDVTVG